ncbi:PQQ-binding-like beta-propeller repeat protein [Natrinema marinum]|uniref:outer membrane protein assembly factor BamB family protein n=1 Tax=Natrinema marinum TaxID=2961598 RepID=UPI0020C91C23|nr:PQQ-binding-like beta-propeller repeat protein [Natrinema marinum]
MSRYARRNLLRAAGLTVAIGTGAVTGSGAAAERTAAEAATTNGTGGWSSTRGDPGNTGFNPDATGPASPVATAWSHDHAGRFAVADGTVYLATDDGPVHAIDATDGTLAWETEITTADDGEAVEATGSPAVAHETVYVTAREPDPDLVAFDAATGDLRWRANDLGYETNQAPVVANELVFVVADQILYALDANSGERRWEFDPEPMPTDGGGTRGDPLQREPVAVANGTVFAVSNNRLFARAVDTGAERWTDTVDDWRSSTFSGRPIAADGVVAVLKNDTVTIYDADTGARRSTVPDSSLDILADDRVYAVTESGDADRSTVIGYEPTGAPVWQPSDDLEPIASAVAGSKAVYAGLEEAGGAAGVVALDRTDGSREWRVDTDATPRQLAVVDDTVYASGDSLVAIRTEGDDRGDDGSSGDSETTPGFTAGTGVASGALLLEWLRRRTATDGERRVE